MPIRQLLAPLLTALALVASCTSRPQSPWVPRGSADTTACALWREATHSVAEGRRTWGVADSVARARHLLDSALRLDPHYEHARYDRAQYLAMLGATALAESDLRQLINTNPHCAPYLLALGVLCHQQGRTAEATELWTRADALLAQQIASSPDSLAPLDLRAHVLQYLGRTAEARALLEGATPVGIEQTYYLGIRLHEVSSQSIESKVAAFWAMPADWLHH